jgi:hypothetical protein
MAIGKNSFVPEGFTRNESGEVVKGKNERRKTVAGVFYQETKNIKRPKKNANVRGRKRENAIEIQQANARGKINAIKTSEWEAENKKRLNLNKEPLTFYQFNVKNNKSKHRRK